MLPSDTAVELPQERFGNKLPPVSVCISLGGN